MNGYGGPEAPTVTGMVGGGSGGGGGAGPSSAKPLEGGARRGTPHPGLLKLERARSLLGGRQDSSSMENVGYPCAFAELVFRPICLGRVSSGYDYS